MALRFAGLGSVVERSATKAAIAQASLSAARRGARSNVAHIAPEVAAAYTLRMTRTRVVFRCDQNIMRATDGSSQKATQKRLISEISLFSLVFKRRATGEKAPTSAHRESAKFPLFL